MKAALFALVFSLILASPIAAKIVDVPLRGKLFAGIATTATGNSCVVFKGVEWIPLEWKLESAEPRT